jgi:hypothetical protein
MDKLDESQIFSFILFWPSRTKRLAGFPPSDTACTQHSAISMTTVVVYDYHYTVLKNRLVLEFDPITKVIVNTYYY